MDPDYANYLLPELIGGVGHAGPATSSQDAVAARSFLDFDYVRLHSESTEEVGDAGATSSQDGDYVRLNSSEEVGNAGDPTSDLGHGQAAGVQPSQGRAKLVEATPMDVDKPETVGEEECDRDEIDGLFCSICMDSWTTGDEHQVCCIPCGHIYGMSCIKKWLHQLGGRGKCPQCNEKCKVKDIRVLYASRIVAVDEELKKKIKSLETKCASLEKKDADWKKKEYTWRQEERVFDSKIKDLEEKTVHLESVLKDLPRRASENNNQDCPNGFRLLTELRIEGARFFDVDIHSQTLILARRLSGMGGSHMLTKIGLLHPHERENIQLPVSMKLVKDLRISPHSRLALLASQGKKLSVFSTESNNVVLTYDIPAAAWSCAWDANDSHYLYAGLQSGMALQFDLRQTSMLVESITGLRGNPIHTMHSLSADSAFSSGIRSVLTASSSGLCHWDFGSSEVKSFLVPESVDQGVCISLAYGPECGDIVASFRPKIEMEGTVSVSQMPSTQSSSILGQAIQGTHVHYKRVGSTDSISQYQKLGCTLGNVSDIRLPRSVVIDRSRQESCFVAGDEATSDLVLRQLPSLEVVERVRALKHPIRDVKYSRMLNSELISCLSDDTLKLFSSQLP